MLKEFKEFALKGNVMDLAIGVIIGGAFSAIVTSLVDDIIMPLVTIFTGKTDFSDLVFTIGSSEIKYGSFITAVVNFLIIAFTIFLVIRSINKMNKKLENLTTQEIEKLKKKGKFGKRKGDKKVEEEAAKVEEPTTKLCPYCYTEINIHATRCPHCTSEIKEEEKV